LLLIGRKLPGTYVRSPLDGNHNEVFENEIVDVVTDLGRKAKKWRLSPGLQSPLQMIRALASSPALHLQNVCFFI
jgi:hypothetical protein